jgi:hypothetical protein
MRNKKIYTLKNKNGKIIMVVIIKNPKLEKLLLKTK